MSIKGIKTIGPKNIEFRSLSEARWAYLFDVLNFDWEYEPMELDGYIPDFIIDTRTGLRNLLVEVKGGEDNNLQDVLNLKKYLPKILKSGWNNNVLLLPKFINDNGLIGLLYYNKKLKPLYFNSHSSLNFDDYFDSLRININIGHMFGRILNLQNLKGNILNLTKWKQDNIEKYIGDNNIYRMKMAIINTAYLELTVLTPSKSKWFLHWDNKLGSGFLYKDDMFCPVIGIQNILDVIKSEYDIKLEEQLFDISILSDDFCSSSVVTSNEVMLYHKYSNCQNIKFEKDKHKPLNYEEYIDKCDLDYNEMKLTLSNYISNKLSIKNYVVETSNELVAQKNLSIGEPIKIINYKPKEFELN